jgi:transcriptional regulator with XRE-family HTH domain
MVLGACTFDHSRVSDDEVRFQKRLGDALRSAREHSGRTQEDIAYNSDVSVRHLSDLERGIKSPNVRTLRRIAKVLGTKASALLRTAEDRTSHP